MSNSFTPLEIKNKLLQALDDQNNIVDMRIIVETISLLEKTALTREALEQTRLGKYVNEIRKKLTSGSAPKDSNQTEISQVAKRAKNLVKRWRDNLLPSNEQSNMLITSEKTFKSEQLILTCEVIAHTVNNVMTDVSTHNNSFTYTSSQNYKEKGHFTEHSSANMSTRLFSTQTHVLEGITAQPLYVNGILSPKNIINLSKEVLDNCQPHLPVKENCNDDVKKLNLPNGNKSISNPISKFLPPTDLLLSHTKSTSICLTQQITNQASTIGAMLNISLSDIQSKCIETISSNTLAETYKPVLPHKPRKLKTTAELMAEIRAKSKVMSLPSMSQVPVHPISPTSLHSNTPNLSPASRTQIIMPDQEQGLTNKRKGRHKKQKTKETSPSSNIIAHSTAATNTLSLTTYSTSDSFVQLKSSKTLAPKLKIIVQEPEILQVLTAPQIISAQPTISTPIIVSSPLPIVSPNPSAPNTSPNGLLDSYISMFTQELKSPEHQIDDTKDSCSHLQSLWDEIDLVNEPYSNQFVNNEPTSFGTSYITDSLNDDKLIVLPFADLED